MSAKDSSSLSECDRDEELGQLVCDPIQKNFRRLVNDCDPSGIADYLFQEGVISNDCVEKVGKSERHDSRLAAARILFLELIQQAKRDCTLRVVDTLVVALNEEGTAGMKEVGEVIAVSRRQAQLDLTALRAALAMDQQDAAICALSVGTHDQQSADEIDGPGDVNGDSEVVEIPQRSPYHLRSHEAADQSEEWRSKDVTQKQILTIAKELATNWLKITYELPNMNKEEKPAFGLHDACVDKLRKSSDGSEDCLTKVLDMWRMMSMEHNQGLLYDTLCGLQFAKVAHNVFQPSV